MPISVKEALDRVNSTTLIGDELTWFKKLCTYTDYYITKKFNGNLVDISFSYMVITIDNKQVNCDCTYDSISEWRKKMIISVWMDTYKNLGWKIIQRGFKQYRFEVDRRDARMNEILEDTKTIE